TLPVERGSRSADDPGSRSAEIQAAAASTIRVPAASTLPVLAAPTNRVPRRPSRWAPRWLDTSPPPRPPCCPRTGSAAARPVRRGEAAGRSVREASPPALRAQRIADPQRCYRADPGLPPASAGVRTGTPTAPAPPVAPARRSRPSSPPARRPLPSVGPSRRRCPSAPTGDAVRHGRLRDRCSARPEARLVRLEVPGLLL